MTDKNLTEIIAIVDRSGSMETIREDAIGGFNTFLKKQQEDKTGKCLITYVQFDTEYEVVHNGIDIQEMPPLTKDTFVPRNATALLDAIGKAINTVGARLAKTPEEKRPGNVVVVILTDGLENSSQEFTSDAINKMVARQTDAYDWGFIYLAQNIDAFATGSSMGFHQTSGRAFLGNIGAGGQSMRSAYAAASSAISDRRMKSADSVCMDWAPVEKANYAAEMSEDKPLVEDLNTNDSSAE